MWFLPKVCTGFVGLRHCVQALEQTEAGMGSSSNTPRPHGKGYAVTENDMT